MSLLWVEWEHGNIAPWLNYFVWLKLENDSSKHGWHILHCDGVTWHAKAANSVLYFCYCTCNNGMCGCSLVGIFMLCVSRITKIWLCFVMCSYCFLICYKYEYSVAAPCPFLLRKKNPTPHGGLLNVLHRRDDRILSMLSSGDEQKEWSYKTWKVKGADCLSLYC